MLKLLFRAVAVTIFTVSATMSWADILVIVHPANTNEVDAKFVKALYLGKETRFADGSVAKPVMLSGESKVSKIFLDKVVDQKPTQFKRLWSKLLFTGKGTPPEELATSEEVLQLVMSQPSAVGFIDSSAYTNDVRAVLRIRTE